MTSQFPQPDPAPHSISPYGSAPATADAYYVAAPIERKPKTADVIVTVILLVFALFGMLSAIIEALLMPQSLADAASARGIDYTPPSTIGLLITVIIVTHVVLFAAAVGISIPLMVKRRLAFWVPLMFGIVAAIIFWAVYILAIVGDSQFLNSIIQQGRP